MIQKNNAYYVENEKLYYYTSAGVKTEIPSSAYGNLLEKIEAIGSPLSYSGAKSVDEINALSNIRTGTVYTVTGTSGTIIAGNITAGQGDEVAYSDPSWFKIGSDVHAGTYSAGPNIDITNFTISGRDWSPEISAKQDVLTPGDGIAILNNIIGVTSAVVTTAELNPTDVLNAISSLNATISAMNGSYIAPSANTFVTAVYQTNGAVSAKYGDIGTVTTADIHNIFNEGA